MNTIDIKRATVDTISDLQKIGIQTFLETFSENNTKENMDKYLAESSSIEKLSSELSNPRSEFYLAYNASDIIGYLKVNSGDAQTELKESYTLEIERIYVLKEYLGRSIGQILLNKAYYIAKENDCKYIWLGVWEKNIRAINFYKKNGFTEFDHHIFKLGDDLQTDIMMKLYL